MIAGGERRYVEGILRRLAQASTSISGWRCKGALLLELLQILDEFEVYKQECTSAEQRAASQEVTSPAHLRELLVSLLAHISQLSAAVAGVSATIPKPMRPILQTVTECLLLQEAEIKSNIRVTLSNAQTAHDYLISKTTITNCPNQELVRRLHHKNQLDILTQI